MPAEDIRRLLEKRPDSTLGLAVPGMPVGSPGMEGTYRESYQVYRFAGNGRRTVFARY